MDKHIKGAFNWLCNAQDISKSGGVSGAYSLLTGWSPAYPETTGYIISTFFDGKKYFKRALRMSDWLVSIQLENGGFQGGMIGARKKPVVFNTGQILEGLVRAYNETKDERYKKSAVRAGDWLVDVQEKDGSWREKSYNEIPHTYHSRVSWPLLELYKIKKKKEYKNAAKKNLDWIISNQLENGYFKNCSFKENKLPNTHAIAYTLRGLLESGIILNEKKYVDASFKTAEILMKKYEIIKWLPASYDLKWNSKDRYTCLTGDAQLSIIWLKIFQLRNDARFLNAALKMNDYLISKQNLSSPFKGVRGGITGSDPIWGRYQPFTYPNWAAKFFIDALMLAEKIMAEIK